MEFHLPQDYHWTVRPEQFFPHLTEQCLWILSTVEEGYHALVRQLFCVETEQRFAYRHIDMYRTAPVSARGDKCFVHQSVAIPAFRLVFRFGKAHRRTHKPPENTALRQRLTILLVYPCSGSVGRDNHYRQVLIIRFGHGRHHIEYRRA